MDVKTCSKCKVTKPLTARHWQRDSCNATGWHSQCKTCRREYDRRRDAVRGTRLSRRLAKAADTANARARAAGVPGTLSGLILSGKLTEQNGRCYWCHCRLGSFHVDHKKPLGTAFFCGDNSPDNVCIACPDCNASKAGQPLASWLSRLAERGIRHELQPADMPVQAKLPLPEFNRLKRLTKFLALGLLG